MFLQHQWIVFHVNRRARPGAGGWRHSGLFLEFWLTLNTTAVTLRTEYNRDITQGWNFEFICFTLIFCFRFLKSPPNCGRRGRRWRKDNTNVTNETDIDVSERIVKDGRNPFRTVGGIIAQRYEIPWQVSKHQRINSENFDTSLLMSGGSAAGELSLGWLWWSPPILWSCHSGDCCPLRQQVET